MITYRTTAVHIILRTSKQQTTLKRHCLQCKQYGFGIIRWVDNKFTASASTAAVVYRMVLQQQTAVEPPNVKLSSTTLVRSHLLHIDAAWFLSAGSNTTTAAVCSTSHTQAEKNDQANTSVLTCIYLVRSTRVQNTFVPVVLYSEVRTTIKGYLYNYSTRV